MQAVSWMGKKNMQLKEVPRPMVTDPTDVLLRVTNTAICGSDLHLYLHGMPGLKSGDVLGHEFMGVVEEVGESVTNLKRGDRVLVAFDIACGQCFFCNHGYQSSCDSTNPSKVQEAMYGQAAGGFFGYSHLTGGYQGGQAEFVRVPFGDINCLKVPEGLTDHEALFLTDILPTAWHANEMGEVHEGDVVAIWGAGPVGILAAHVAQHRGARRVIMIDSVQDRLDFVKQKLPGVETLNYKEKETVSALREMTADEPGRGPDVVIEAAGFHYSKSWLHAIEMKLQVETDTADMLNEMITAVRKGGRISIVGVYVGYVNHLNIGAFMEKQLTMRGGQTPTQRYWPTLLPKVQAGELKPSMVITHVLPLEQAPKGFQLFNDKQDGCIKVVLQPGPTAAVTMAPAGST
ncbi:GroES-like protein [Scenedesmus sp. NREL 46B-D3]|nr:GroES-like protein [Scenedesmus sp. NREL 46B-D3]